MIFEELAQIETDVDVCRTREPLEADESKKNRAGSMIWHYAHNI